jgi:hypothetical protein
MVAATDLDVLRRCMAGHVGQAGIIHGGTAHLLFVGLGNAVGTGIMPVATTCGHYRFIFK